MKVIDPRARSFLVMMPLCSCDILEFLSILFAVQDLLPALQEQCKANNCTILPIHLCSEEIKGHSMVSSADVLLDLVVLNVRPCKAHSH